MRIENTARSTSVSARSGVGRSSAGGFFISDEAATAKPATAQPIAQTAGIDALLALQSVEDPLFADFFYYAVMVALTSPPEGIVPLSRGTRSATMIEILTGLALLTTYVSSLVQLRRREGVGRPPAAVDESEPGA